MAEKAERMRRKDPQAPDWNFIQWDGTNEQAVLEYLGATLSGLAGYRSLDGSSLLLLAYNTGGPLVFNLDYAVAGSWVAVNPDPATRQGWLVVVADEAGSPAGFELSRK